MAAAALPLNGFADQANLALASGRAAKPQAQSADPTKVRAAAQQFVGMFMSQMFSHMFEGAKTDTMFGGGPGEEMFRSVLVDEYGKAAAKSNSLGMTDQIMRALLSHQEVAS